MFAELLPNLITLGLLTLLQAVLGFDNLLYISLESKRAPEKSRKAVRIWGIGIAIFLRIALLFVLVNLIKYFQKPFWTVGDVATDHGTAGAEAGAEAAHGTGETTSMQSADWFAVDMNLHSLIVLIGGAFIIYTATKEVWHMMRLEEHASENDKPKGVAKVVFWIVLMNVIFSFDSILSAMALTDVLWVMIIAIIISGVLMIWLSDRVSVFLEKNRMYEVLGLFILFVVGIMLLTEGGHLAHLRFFGQEIVPMSKTTFYFVIGVLVFTDIVQTRYQRNLLAKAARAKAHAKSHAANES